MNSIDYNQHLTHIALWFSSKIKNKYFLFTNQERDIYFIFQLDSPNYNKVRYILDNIIQSQGELIKIKYNHTQDFYDIFISDGLLEHKYKLFACDERIINI